MLPLYLFLSYIYLLISSAVPRANAAAGKSIFLLAGQSNMAGRGGVMNDTWDNYVPPESFPDLAILRLGADLSWQLATEPLHRDIDTNKVCGVGPGMAFARSLLRKDSSIGVVGLVPCAVGGTNISEWARGGDLYKRLIRRAEAALEVGGTIRGLLWYQGESDTVRREDAESYKTRLQNFILHVRTDLLLPVLPVIQVALASGEGPYIEMVREAQLGMDLVNLRTIDAKGLNLEPDGLHLTTPSQVTLGNMLANAFMQTRPSAIISTNIASTIITQNFFTHFSFVFLGSEQINKEGAVEIKVDSVNYKSPEGKDEPTKVVEVNPNNVGDKASDYANPGEALSSQVRVDPSQYNKCVPNK